MRFSGRKFNVILFASRIYLHSECCLGVLTWLRDFEKHLTVSCCQLQITLMHRGLSRRQCYRICQSQMRSSSQELGCLRMEEHSKTGSRSNKQTQRGWKGWQRTAKRDGNQQNQKTWLNMFNHSTQSTKDWLGQKLDNQSHPRINALSRRALHSSFSCLFCVWERRSNFWPSGNTPTRAHWVRYHSFLADFPPQVGCSFWLWLCQTLAPWTAMYCHSTRHKELSKQSKQTKPNMQISKMQAKNKDRPNTKKSCRRIWSHIV